MKSAIEEYLDEKQRVVYTPCKNLKRLVVGERVMVNWFPPGESRAGKVLRFEEGKPLVELGHDGAILAIESAEQIQWQARLHPSKK